MSSIIFEGNTYTFGATVSANPGTGTTSYVFGGLSSGWTYGFILWAFNGFGPSSIVGPSIRTTLSASVPETRNAINAFTWEYQNKPVYDRNAYTNGGNTYNLFTSSADLSNTYAWTWTNGTSVTTGITAPDGSTTAWNLFAVFGPNSRLFRQNTYYDFGNTYIVSYYMDVTNSVFKNGATITLQRPTDTFGQWIQIDANSGDVVPVTPDQFGNAPIVLPAGASGWTRFNFRRYHTSFTRESVLNVLWMGGGSAGYIVWGLQLEKA